MLLGFDFLTHNQMVKNLTHSASDTSPIINFPVEAIKAIKAKQIISVGTSYVIVHQPQKFGQKMGWFLNNISSFQWRRDMKYRSSDVVTWSRDEIYWDQWIIGKQASLSCWSEILHLAEEWLSVVLSSLAKHEIQYIHFLKKIGMC